MSRLSEGNIRLAKEIIGRYPRPRSAMIPLLHMAQQQVSVNWIPVNRN